MRVRAKFVGEDGSMGYHQGQTYDLVIKGSTIYSTGSPCPYRSLEAFFRNWIVVE